MIFGPQRNGLDFAAFDLGPARLRLGKKFGFPVIGETEFGIEAFPHGGGKLFAFFGGKPKSGFFVGLQTRPSR